MPRLERQYLTSFLLAIWLALPAAAAEPDRVGLVLSGGGARGLAHVGVLKVLEREHIPVDVIAGTSMGAIIGGLYASGLSAEQMERELLRIDWGRMFVSRVDRQQLSQRRKEEEFEFSAAIEFGLRNGELLAPQGTLSSRGLEILLRRLTLPVRAAADFDHLPTPFRAIATDMETGGQLVLSDGSLAQAMRSSMSVPGVFAPTELLAPTPASTQAAPRGGAGALGSGPSSAQDLRILGDGGLVNNLPIDVARSMGARRVIAVNVGTPLSNRASLSSLVGVTAQMLTILTEQNVQRSIASLGEQDLLITPQLGEFTAGDFARTAQLIKLGEEAAESMLPQLRRYAVSPQAYATWRLARQQVPAPAPRLADVGFSGSEQTHPGEQVLSQFASKAGEAFDQAKAERDASLLTSSGDYERVDYHVEPRTDAKGQVVGEGLNFVLEDKPWGPNYFRVGIDLSTDLSGNSAFNLRLSHNRHWLTKDGLEWRNQASIGQNPRLFTELYQPLSLKFISSDWFVSGWGDIERRNIKLYEPDSGRELGEVSRQAGSVGLDLGQPWGGFGELRLGLVHESWRIRPVVIGPDLQLQDGQIGQVWNETGLRLRAVVDQLDYANFPQGGYRLVAEYVSGKVSGGPNDRRASFDRAEGQATWVHSWGPHTLNLHGRGLIARQPEDSTQGPYSLGGFQQLSGYKPGQLAGRALVFGRASYYLRLGNTPVLSRGVFVGGSLEAGNAWQHAHDISFGDLRYAASLFVGTDTGLGPLYLAIGRAPQGGSAVYLFIGRP